MTQTNIANILDDSNCTVVVFLSISADRLIPVISEAVKQAGSWREHGGHRVVNIGPISRKSLSIYSSWSGGKERSMVTIYNRVIWNKPELRGGINTTICFLPLG
jgi:hypothetical protein